MPQDSSFVKKIPGELRQLYTRIRKKPQEPLGRAPHDARAAPDVSSAGDGLSIPLLSRPEALAENPSAIDREAHVRDHTDTGSTSAAATRTPPANIANEHYRTGALPPAIHSGPSQPARQTVKNVLKGTLVVLSSISEGLPLPAVKGIIDTVTRLILVFEATAANTESLRELDARCLRLLEVVVKPLKAKNESEISPEFRAIIHRLESRLLELLSEIEKPQSGIVARMVNYEDISSALKDVNDNITQHIDFFMLEAHVLGLLSQEKLAKAVEKHALHQVIQSLPRANAGYDSYLDTAQTRSVCFPNTRQQLLGEIMEWMTSTDPSKPSMYILDGIAGIGKSTVAQTIAERCAQLGYLGASFFFSRAENDRKTARLFFSTLAFDLACYSPEFAHSMQAALELTPNAAEKALHQQLKYLLVNPLQSLSLKQPIVLVIDALDECEKTEAAAILSLLSSNLQGLPGFRIFITTRPEPHIHGVLRKYQGYRHFHLHEIEASIVEADIKAYLAYELSIPRVQEVLPGCEWKLDENHFNSLVENAGRLFIIASTVIRFILDQRRRNPHAQMMKMLSAFRNERSLDVTKVMDGMYLKVLQSGILEGSDEDDIKLFQTVIGTIIVLENPLPLNSLASFLALDQSEVVTTLLPMHSIIAPSSTDQTPQIYHKSFPDFITDLTRCMDKRLYIALDKHHAEVAIYCFNVLNAKLHQNMCKLEGLQKLGLNKDIDAQGLIKDQISPELIYACTYWATHLSKAGNNKREQLLDLLKEFFFTHFLHWLEALSWLGKVGDAYPAVIMAQKFVADISGEKDLKSLLFDAGRCVTKYYTIIARAAMHIYCSVIPFLPRGTLIYQVYAVNQEKSVTIIKGQEQDWSPLLAVLKEHSAQVTSVSFSPDGSRLASCSDDKTARLWDGLTGASISTLEGHSDAVMSVVFSPDGSKLASASHDKTVRLWNGFTGAAISTLEGHSDAVRLVTFSPDGSRLASGSLDNTVKLWDGFTGAAVLTLKGHSDAVRPVIFSPDGSRVASGSDDNTVRLWDGLTGTSIAKLEGHSFYVISIAFSPDGSRLASGSYDNTVRLWNGFTGAFVSMMVGHSDAVTSVMFSPDGSKLASSSLDNTVQLWDGFTGSHVFTLEGHSGWVTSVVFSPSGSRLVSASVDNTLRLWDGLTGTPISTLSGHSGAVTSVVFSPDGWRLASGSHDKTVMLWDEITGASNPILEGHSDAIRFVVVSPNGSRLASGSHDKSVKLWDGLTGTFISTLAGHSATVTTAAFSPDGFMLASGSLDKIVRLWDGVTGAATFTLEGHSGTIRSITFSPDGSTLASGSFDATVRLWDVLTGTSISVLRGHSGAVVSMVFSPDGSILASGSHDKTVRLWNGLIGSSISILQGHSSWVTSVVFSPDGSILTSGSDDKIYKVWDTSAYMYTLHGPLDSVRPAVFSNDSPKLILDGPSLNKTQYNQELPTVDHSGISTQLNLTDVIQVNNAIFYKDLNAPIIYVPLDFAISCSLSVYKTYIACGCSSGKIIILDIHPHLVTYLK